MRLKVFFKVKGGKRTFSFKTSPQLINSNYFDFSHKVEHHTGKISSNFHFQAKILKFYNF
jgi:hypothetical protein